MGTTHSHSKNGLSSIFFFLSVSRRKGPSVHLTWGGGAWPMVDWKLVVKTWSLERKHRAGHTSAVPRENVNAARIKFCRRFE